MDMQVVLHSVADIGIRHIRPDDLPLMRRFVASLSRETSYRRLLSPRTPTEDELRGWTEVDPSREIALVALSVGEAAPAMVGVARCVTEEQGDADFAIVITDAWQGQGLGRALLVRLIQAAKDRGLRRLTGVTLPDNLAMLALARSLGFKSRRTAGAESRVVLDLGS